PPEFNTGQNFTAEKNAPTDLSFPLRTYTTNFSDCLLQKISETACERNCTSFVSLVGSPPDLTLTLEFGRLSSEKKGTWNLTLFNDGGQGSVEFSLIKIDPVRRKSGDGAQLHSDSAFKDDEVSPRHSGQDEECVMIPNPVYEGTYGRHAPLESPYFEVADSLRKTPQNAENQAAGGPGSKADNSDYGYVDAEVVQGWKDSARAAKTDDKLRVYDTISTRLLIPVLMPPHTHLFSSFSELSDPCTPDEYVSVEDIKKRKQQAK
ncbi:hypothetical protein BaRGS_00039387, partial [Batillaria attramentaria]